MRQAERIGLGTAYADVVGRVKRVVDTLGLECVVVVDESGVGVPVVESRRKEVRCTIRPIMITTGQHATASSVPRAELVTRLQMMIQAGELEVAWGCRDGDELERELVHLHLSGKSGEEPDDLAMALALACLEGSGTVKAGRIARRRQRGSCDAYQPPGFMVHVWCFP